MLCYVGRSKSLSLVDHNSLHLHNLSRVHLFNHVRCMCYLCVVNLLCFLDCSLLVILVLSKYMLLSQISLANSNGHVSSCLNFNCYFDFITTSLLQLLTKLLKRLFFSLEIRRSHKWENDRSILYFDFDQFLKRLGQLLVIHE